MKRISLIPIAMTIACVAPAQSLTTTFNDNFPGAPNWSTFFDLQVNVALDIHGFDCNVTSPVGAVGTLDVYMTAVGGTHVGNERTPGVWTLVGTGLPTVSLGAMTPTGVAMSTPIAVAPGTYGVAVHHRGLSFGNSRFTGLTYSNNEMTLTAGSVTLAAPGMTSPTIFNGHVFNTTIYYNGFATTDEYGQGCGPAPLGLRSLGRPVMGGTVGLETYDIPAGSPAVGLMYGVTAFDPGLDLSPIDMIGCSLYVDAELVVPFVPDGATEWTQMITIGTDPIFEGVSFFFQSAAISFDANPFGVMVSNGVAWKASFQ